MKIVLYILILTAVLLIPNRGTDVGKLIPVEVIAVSESGNMVTVRTDTGDMGKGETLGAAFADMKATAAGVIYLDTAEYLLLEPGTKKWELAQYLKESVQVYYAREGLPLNGVADYLSVRKSKATLKKIEEAEAIPAITEKDGRYGLDQK